MSCSRKQVEKEAPFINKISQNEKFKINLPEVHSDGNLWRFSETFDATVLDYTGSVWRGNTNGVDFNFNTLATGQTTLTFVLKKRLDTISIKQFVVEIGPK
jgi:hypothetical protein